MSLFKTTLILIVMFIVFPACSPSPESRLKAVDFKIVKVAVDEEDLIKSKKLMASEIEAVGKLCESLKSAKIEFKHLDAVDSYRRLEFMMALGGFYKLQEGLNKNIIREISQKDREEIKYICDKLVFDANKILKEKSK